MKWATIYALILLILIYIHNGYGIDVLVLYAVGIVLLYTVAIGATEFQLLMYCRFKFKSFHMSWKRMRECVGEFESEIQNPNRKVNKSEIELK